MLKTRIIPVLLLLNGIIVQSRGFKRYQLIGSPTSAIARLSSWSCDEIIYIDISKEPFYNLRRDDLGHCEFDTIEDIVSMISKKCNMPLTFGGGIKCVADVERRLFLGADKVTINSMAIEKPELIKECSEKFGSQAIVVSIDVRNKDGLNIVYKGGREETNIDFIEHAKMMQDYGAGEILLNSMDRDGQGKGFDVMLVNRLVDNITIPVISLGGAGRWEDFSSLMDSSNVSAIAAANIFHHSENSVYSLKKYLYEQGYNVRKPFELSTTNSLL